MHSTLFKGIVKEIHVQWALYWNILQQRLVAVTPDAANEGCTDMTKTRNGLENGLINGLEGTSLKMLFCNRNLLRKSLLKRTKHVTAALTNT